MSVKNKGLHGWVVCVPRRGLRKSPTWLSRVFAQACARACLRACVPVRACVCTYTRARARVCSRRPPAGSPDELTGADRSRGGEKKGGGKNCIRTYVRTYVRFLLAWRCLRRPPVGLPDDLTGAEGIRAGQEGGREGMHAYVSWRTYPAAGWRRTGAKGEAGNPYSCLLGVACVNRRLDSANDFP